MNTKLNGKDIDYWVKKFIRDQKVNIHVIVFMSKDESHVRSKFTYVSHRKDISTHGSMVMIPGVLKFDAK